MYVNHDNRARSPGYHDLRILLFSCHGEKGKSELQHAFLRVGFTLSKKLGNHSKRRRMPILSFLLTFPEATPEKVEKWHEMNS